MVKISYQPCVLVIYSPMYHGKTTVAQVLANRSNLRYFDLDDIKREMFANEHEPLNGSPESRTEENTRRTNAAYTEAARRAVELFRQGIPSVFSGTFSWASFKAPFIEVAESGEVPQERLKIYNLDVDSLDEIRRRIKARSQDPSVDAEAKLKSYRWSKEQQTKAPWPKEMGAKTIDAMQEIEQVVAEIIHDLEQLQQAA